MIVVLIQLTPKQDVKFLRLIDNIEQDTNFINNMRIKNSAIPYIEKIKQNFVDFCNAKSETKITYVLITNLNKGSNKEIPCSQGCLMLYK